jgi:hypothetical protein
LIALQLSISGPVTTCTKLGSTGGGFHVLSLKGTALLDVLRLDCVVAPLRNALVTGNKTVQTFDSHHVLASAVRRRVLPLSEHHRPTAIEDLGSTGKRSQSAASSAGRLSGSANSARVSSTEREEYATADTWAWASSSVDEQAVSVTPRQAKTRRRGARLPKTRRGRDRRSSPIALCCRAARPHRHCFLGSTYTGA